MQLPPVQMTDKDGDAGMETLLSVTPLAQAAVSVQNPPPGSQTCFSGWLG